MHHGLRSLGITRIDMLLIGALLLVLAFMMVPSLSLRAAVRRDEQRVADMLRVEAAIARYWSEHGSFPPAHENPEQDDWDVSTDGDFIPALRQGGYLSDTPTDPCNDEQFQYRYRVFPRGSFGCAGDGPVYVLGVRSFETVEWRGGSSGGFSCPDRDFSREFAWVRGNSVPAH